MNVKIDLEKHVGDAVREVVRDEYREEILDAANDAVQEVARSMVPRSKVGSAIEKLLPAAAKQAVAEIAAQLAGPEVRKALDGFTLGNRLRGEVERIALAALEAKKAAIVKGLDVDAKEHVKRLREFVRLHAEGIARSWLRGKLDDEIDIDADAVARVVQKELVDEFRARSKVVAEKAFAEAETECKRWVREAPENLKG